MIGLVRYFVAHRTAANLMMVAMLLAGVAALTQMRAQFFPDVVVERLTVRVNWDGAGPEEVDEAIVGALQPGLIAIDGVDSVRTTAREGRGSLVLEFEPGVNLSDAADEVRAAVDQVTTLPDEVDEPEIRRGRFFDRVLTVIVSGPVSVPLLKGYADEIETALFQRGVTRVSVSGAPKREIQIDVSAEAVERHGITLTEIAEAVSAAVESRPAGALGDGGARVRAGEARKSAAALSDLVIRGGGSGERLLLRDVAKVTEGAPDRLGVSGSNAYFSGGDPAIQLLIDRHAGGDAIAIQRIVEQVTAEIGSTLPDGVDIQLTRKASQAIIDRLDLLVRNAGGGLLIVLALLFLFLSARTAIWVAAGIPTAFLAAIALMWMAGLSFNMVSLFALIICIGIVVDDAIVVGEHADTLRRRGFSASDAAAEAARRMSGPVFTASLTTIIAFLGLMAVGGRFGELIGDIPKTVTLVILASLVEVFLILPAHMRHALAAQASVMTASALGRSAQSDARKKAETSAETIGPMSGPKSRATSRATSRPDADRTRAHKIERPPWWDRPSAAVNRGFDWVRERAFRPVLRVALRWRYAVVAGAIALFIQSLALLTSGDVRWFFFNAPERNTVIANFSMDAGATRADTFAMLEEMRRAAEAVNAQLEAEYGVAPIVADLGKLGGAIGRSLSSAEAKEPDQLGGFELELVDRDARPFPSSVVTNAWRDEIDAHPLLDELSLRWERSGPAGDAIDVELYGGADARVLKAAAEAVRLELAALPGVSALDDSLPYDKPELIVTLTPKGEALGFTTQSLGVELRARLEGLIAARFPSGGDEVEVVVAAPAEALDAGFLERTLIAAPRGGTVPLSDVARLDERQGFASVKRLDGERIVQVTGEVVDDAAAREAVAEALETRILPQVAARYGVRYELGGLREQEREFFGDALLGFIACLIGIYACLAWVFSSWTRPFAIILVIPLGFIGAIWGHYWMGVPLSMFSVVGLIGMAGIIINDSIVLVTTFDETAKRRPIRAAIEEGAVDRLRAVFLTTVTTVGGLTPLLFEQSVQAAFLKPTVVTLAYGLGFGMVLVLIVTPAVALIQHDVAAALRSARRLVRLGVRRRPPLGGRV